MFLRRLSFRKAEEENWWDNYSSGGLDDEQVYGGIVQGNYIMENIFHKKGTVEKIKGEEREQWALHWDFVL